MKRRYLRTIPGLAHAIRTIKEAKSIAILCHIHPDGDAIGSLLSLGLGLKAFGKRVYMLSPDGVPKTYQALASAGLIKKTCNKKTDLVITVDCSAGEMLGRSLPFAKNAQNILEIDHHLYRKPFGHSALVDPGATAVGEIIYLLLQRLGITITPSIAQSILASIIVETNAFRLPNTNARTFRICAQLFRFVDFHRFIEMIYWSKRKETALLSGICLARCKFIEDNRIAWSIVRRNDFRLVHGIDGDVDPVPDEIRTIKGVEIVVFFRERNSRLLRVSLRSKGKANVGLLATSFGGGGHFDSAGCLIPNSQKMMRKLLRQAQALL